MNNPTKFVLVLCVSVVMVLAIASTALAQPGTSGRVYGTAQMTPTYSIVLSGQGVDSDMPLNYIGHKGQNVPESEGRQTVVENNGDDYLDLILGSAQDPSDGAGSTWAFGDPTSGSDVCDWHFTRPGDDFSVPENGWAFMGGLDAGDSWTLDSDFTFPSNFNGNVHSMQAIIAMGED